MVQETKHKIKKIMTTSTFIMLSSALFICEKKPKEIYLYYRQNKNQYIFGFFKNSSVSVKINLSQLNDDFSRIFIFLKFLIVLKKCKIQFNRFYIVFQF